MRRYWTYATNRDGSTTLFPHETQAAAYEHYLNMRTCPGPELKKIGISYKAATEKQVRRAGLESAALAVN
jgi:hypothetical protein